MKILLDKNVDERLRHHLSEHTVHTARHMGWGALPNGRLLDTAERNGYDLIITCDRGMLSQQNWQRRTILPLLIEQGKALTDAFVADIKARIG